MRTQSFRCLFAICGHYLAYLPPTYRVFGRQSFCPLWSTWQPWGGGASKVLSLLWKKLDWRTKSLLEKEESLDNECNFVCMYCLSKIFVCMHKIDDLWMKTCLIKMKKKIFVSVKHFNFEQARILIKYYLVLKRAKN